MNQRQVEAVWRLAHDRCEYCRIASSDYRLPFQIDHIIARQHGGSDDLENLALACLHCNRHKGPNIAGRDPITGQIERLFNPRKDAWSEHLQLRGAVLFGLTAIGRVTVHVLAMNEPEFLAARAALVEEGRM